MTNSTVEESDAFTLFKALQTNIIFVVAFFANIEGTLNHSISRGYNVSGLVKYGNHRFLKKREQVRLSTVITQLSQPAL